MMEARNGARKIAEQRQETAALEDALAATRESEERFRTMLATIPTLAWYTTADGNAQFYTQRWFDYTGLSFEEAKDNGWTKAIRPDDLKRIYGRWLEIMTSEKPGEVEARFRRYDGVYRWHLFRAAPLFDDHGNLTRWYGTNTDIDDLKRAEEELRRSKIYLEYAQRLSHTGAVGMRVADGKLFWSDETARIYGYDPAVPPTMEMVLARAHPDDLPVLQEVFAQAEKGGANFDFKHRLLMPDGAIKYLHDYATTVKSESGAEEILGVVMDITEQTKAEAALQDALARIRDSEDQLRTHINTMPGLAWTAGPNGEAEFLSQGWLNYSGMSNEEVQGSGWTNALHPDDAASAIETWQNIIATKRAGELEARLRRFDGVYRWFTFRGAPLVDQRGNVVKWYGVNVDIEDQKQAEIELRRKEADLLKAQAELAHVTRVTTMGEFAVSIAHEVNQPIAGVVINGNACLRWLAREQSDSANIAEAQEAVRRIIRDGARAGEIIARIRDLFKKRGTAKELLHINDVIAEVIVLARSEIEKRRVTLRLDLASGLPCIPGDRVQLQQVMLNLILNGIDAMSTLEDRQRDLYVATGTFENTHVLVKVRDTGTGIDPESIDHLFTAFFTTKPDGLGMGLSISRSIVESHNGRIWATTNDGPGATFQFTLSTHSHSGSSDIKAVGEGFP